MSVDRSSTPAGAPALVSNAVRAVMILWFSSAAAAPAAGDASAALQGEAAVEASSRVEKTGVAPLERLEFDFAKLKEPSSVVAVLRLRRRVWRSGSLQDSGNWPISFQARIIGSRSRERAPGIHEYAISLDEVHQLTGEESPRSGSTDPSLKSVVSSVKGKGAIDQRGWTSEFSYSGEWRRAYSCSMIEMLLRILGLSLHDLGPIFPASPVGPGAEWIAEVGTSTRYSTRFTLVARSGQLVTLRFNGSRVGRPLERAWTTSGRLVVRTDSLLPVEGEIHEETKFKVADKDVIYNVDILLLQ